MTKRQTAKNCKKHQKQKFIAVYIKKFISKNLYEKGYIENFILKSLY